MGTTQLVLTVLAFSSPLVCLAGYFSLTIMTSGNTAPLAFVIVTAVLLIFSVGYVAMTKRMPRPGAFYAYISSGIGRPIGLASAFLATVSYTVIGMGVYCFAGMVVTGLITTLGGPDIPWWLGALVVWGLIGTLGYFNVEVSARVLMWVMIVEVVLVMIFNIAVVGQGGESGLNLSPFNLAEFFSGEVAVGLLFAMLVFIGFEATALYRDEVKDPDKTIGRATYTAVIFIGILYTFTVWVMVMAFGNDAAAVAAEDPGGMFAIASDIYVGTWFTNIVTALVVTAALASILSIHNASTRYLFNLGADGALPRFFGTVHPRFKAPSHASMTISALVLVGNGLFVLNGSDPGVLYGQMAGLGNIGIFFLMALVSIAVVVWFRRTKRQEGDNLWKTLIAPIIAAVFLVALVTFSIANFDLVVGGQPGENLGLLVVLGISFALGLVIALIMKFKRPASYRAIGRHEQTDIHHLVEEDAV